MDEKIPTEKSNTFLNKVNNSFNIIKDKKKFKEITLYYLNEKLNLVLSILIFHLILLTGIILHIFRVDPLNLNTMDTIDPCLIILIIMAISFIASYLTFITLFQIENYRQKHKGSFWDKFLNKSKKSEPAFKNIIKEIIFLLFKLLIIFFTLIFLIIIILPTKPYLASAISFIVISYLIIIIIDFIINLITILSRKNNL